MICILFDKLRFSGLKCSHTWLGRRCSQFDTFAVGKWVRPLCTGNLVSRRCSLAYISAIGYTCIHKRHGQVLTGIGNGCRSSPNLARSCKSIRPSSNLWRIWLARDTCSHTSRLSSLFKVFRIRCCTRELLHIRRTFH